jgi:hypothetical protein
MEFECLLEAAVLAMEDEVLGEAVKPYLVARMPWILRSRLTCCKRHLLPNLVPKEFVLVPARPKNSAESVETYRQERGGRRKGLLVTRSDHRCERRRESLLVFVTAADRLDGYPVMNRVLDALR